MTTFKTEDGREISFNHSIVVKEDHWLVDGEIVSKLPKVCVYRALVTPSGTVLRSEHQHDFKSVEEEGIFYMIDGGIGEYYRCSELGDIVEYYSTDSIELLRTVMYRSGYGKDGKGEFRKFLLMDMSDEWVKSSIDYVNSRINSGQPGNYLKVLPEIYQKELDYRKSVGIYIKD